MGRRESEAMTPTTPRKFTATPVTAGVSAPAPAGGSAAPAGAPAAGAGAGKKKRPLLLMIGVAALVLIGVVSWLGWKWTHPAPPLLTAPTEPLAKYILDPEFQKLGFDKQAPYLDVIDRRYDDKECEKLWRAGKLTEMQMAELRDAAWMGKHMGRMQEYYSLPPGTQRKSYIAERVDKKFDDDEPEDPQPPKPASASDEGEKVPKREKSWGKKLVATWPMDVQAQWKEYHKEIKKEEDRRDKEAKKGAATKAAG